METRAAIVFSTHAKPSFVHVQGGQCTQPPCKRLVELHDTVLRYIAKIFHSLPIPYILSTKSCSRSGEIAAVTQPCGNSYEFLHQTHDKRWNQRIRTEQCVTLRIAKITVTAGILRHRARVTSRPCAVTFQWRHPANFSTSKLANCSSLVCLARFVVLYYLLSHLANAGQSGRSCPT